MLIEKTADFDETYLGFFSDEELQAISSLEITNPNPLDLLGNPVQGGVYDKRLETLRYGERYHFLQQRKDFMCFSNLFSPKSNYKNGLCPPNHGRQIC